MQYMHTAITTVDDVIWIRPNFNLADERTENAFLPHIIETLQTRKIAYEADE